MSKIEEQAIIDMARAYGFDSPQGKAIITALESSRIAARKRR